MEIKLFLKKVKICWLHTQVSELFKKLFIFYSLFIKHKNYILLQKPFQEIRSFPSRGNEENLKQIFNPFSCTSCIIKSLYMLMRTPFVPTMHRGTRWYLAQSYKCHIAKNILIRWPITFHFKPLIKEAKVNNCHKLINEKFEHITKDANHLS